MIKGDRIKQIYLYKGVAFLREVDAPRDIENYYSMPDDSTSFWQKCKKEDYEQAKYYGMPAEENHSEVGEGKMNTITILRMVSENIEYCREWEIVNASTKIISVVLHFDNPVDQIVWRFRSEYFNENIKQLFESAELKKRK